MKKNILVLLIALALSASSFCKADIFGLPNPTDNNTSINHQTDRYENKIYNTTNKPKLKKNTPKYTLVPFITIQKIGCCETTTVSYRKVRVQ